MTQRQLYIIAGCNGAGKTTAARSLLPETLGINEFVNADEIARGLSPFNADAMAIKAGRLMLERISELLAAGQSFAIETTLASKSYVSLVLRAQRSGYVVHLLFFYLRDVELARLRVAERVAHGGHGIAAEVIERRFHAGLKNLFTLFTTLVDRWVIYDNSERHRSKIATGGRAMSTIVYQQAKYESMISHE